MAKSESNKSEEGAEKDLDEEKESGLDAPEPVIEKGPTNKGKRFLLLMLPVSLALIASIAYLFISHSSNNETGTIEVSKQNPGSKAEYQYVDMNDIIVTIASTQAKKNYLKLSISLQVKTTEAADLVSSRVPLINDSFQTFLRELRPGDLSGSAGVLMLKAQLLKRVNAIVAPQEVLDVLFKEMILS
ncbi:MAG: flagellar basal body-associated FliL family protein [Rickettsiaceae bacterium]|nr:flagellar basal body-associated FliL family protein [Rickettsiaceae bacterium]